MENPKPGWKLSLRHRRASPHPPESTKPEPRGSWLSFLPVVRWGQGQALLLSPSTDGVFSSPLRAAFAPRGQSPALSHAGLDAPAVRLLFIPPRSLGMDLFKTLETLKSGPLLAAFRAHAPLAGCPGN